MKLRDLIPLLFGIFMLTLTSCPSDDESDFNSVPDRDRTEVYLEDIEEIETYLETHFYNYEAFDFDNLYTNPDNDEFKVVLDTIEGINATKTPLMDQVVSKTVTDESGLEYTLYYIVIREGLGKSLHALDRAVVSYEGHLLLTEDEEDDEEEIFDSSIVPIPFTLTAVGLDAGVVQGFREGLLEFNTSTGFTDNTDGTTVYHNHGIGIVFIPSGLGYFSNFVGSIPQYSPLIFDFSLIDRQNTDYDGDGIPSHLEDLNANGDGADDNTDEDNFANFVDFDDDQDDVLTMDEIVTTSYNMPTKQDIENLVLATNEVLISNQGEADGTYTGVIVTFTDTDNDGTPDYLDSDSSPE